MGFAMPGIIQDEYSECADGARLHHLGEYASEQLLNHHDALAQLIAGYAVYRAGAVERRHGSSCSSSGRAQMRKLPVYGSELGPCTSSLDRPRPAGTSSWPTPGLREASFEEKDAGVR